ncbi:MAG: hypothetical protein HYX84_00260 [Chloroflexi bacterium]|nr:hypothetical protein [Chloroflexota bacterium]
MIEDLYTEKLNWFKQNERPEVVLLLTDNPDLVKIVVAWISLDVGRADKLTDYDGESESESWKWLWQNTVYRLGELKQKIGTSLSETALENKMNPLIGNRIIYPDGTVNSFVERYIREQVVKLFEAKPKWQGKKQ